MSKVNDQIYVSISLSEAIIALRNAARTFGSFIEKGNNVFSIKDNIQRTSWSTTWPATVTISFQEAQNGVIISFESKNFGCGPIQSKECASKLGAVKSALLYEIDQLSIKNNPSSHSEADELLKYKQLLDMGAISHEEFEIKKRQLLGF